MRPPSPSPRPAETLGRTSGAPAAVSGGGGAWRALAATTAATAPGAGGGRFRPALGRGRPLGRGPSPRHLLDRGAAVRPRLGPPTVAPWLLPGQRRRLAAPLPPQRVRQQHHCLPGGCQLAVQLLQPLPEQFVLRLLSRAQDLQFVQPQPPAGTARRHPVSVVGEGRGNGGGKSLILGRWFPDCRGAEERRRPAAQGDAGPGKRGPIPRAARSARRGSRRSTPSLPATRQPAPAPSPRRMPAPPPPPAPPVPPSSPGRGAAPPRRRCAGR